MCNSLNKAAYSNFEQSLPACAAGEISKNGTQIMRMQATPICVDFKAD